MRWLLPALWLLSACDEPPEASPPPAAAPSVSAAAKQASTCVSMCERAATCGVELASELADTAGPEARQAVARAKTDAAAREAACTKRCGAATMSERDAIMARRCLAKDACGAFVDCLDEG